NGCEQLNEISKLRIKRYLDLATGELYRKCILSSIKAEATDLKQVETAHQILLDQYRSLKGNDFGVLVRCEPISQGVSSISSLVPPSSIIMRYSGGRLDEKIDDNCFAHEVAHIILRNACLLEKRFDCAELGENESLVNKVSSTFSKCMECSPPGCYMKGGVNASLVSAAAPEEISRQVASTTGVDVSTVDMGNVRLPTTPQKMQELAYLPAAQVMAERDPDRYSYEVARMAKAMLRHGEKLFGAIKTKVPDFSVLPYADATTADLQLTRYKSDVQIPGGTSQGKTAVAQIDGALVKPTRKGRAESIQQRGSQREGESEDADAFNDDASSSSGGGSSSRGGSAGGIAIATSGGGKAAKGTAKNKAGNPPAASAGNDRTPAAINQSQFKPEEVAKALKTELGGEVMAKLQNAAFVNVLANKLKIAIFDLANNQYGAEPGRASSCYIIRDMTRKLTPINCVGRKK
ncbi:MAG: hypothetical protein AB7N80_10425, partial [Bdellovibrionales bacterium]